MIKMKAIKNAGSATSPKNFPNIVNGTKIARMHMIMVNRQTILEAWLSINGILAVRIMCNPIKLDTIPQENQIV